LDKLEYREKIRAILIRFQENKLMTVQETIDQIIDQIMEVELPEESYLEVN